MNQIHPPRLLIIGLFSLVAVTFFAGLLRTFTPAYALADATGTASITAVSSPVVVNTPETDIDESTTLTPVLEKGYADTNGIIALGIVLVVVILIGVTWGGRNSRGKKK
jgi:hypothetical protein